MGGYAQTTAAGLYGTDVMGAYGVAIAVGDGAGAAQPSAAADPGQGYSLAVPRDFWRSSGFGLILLVLLVLYLDVRILNR